MICPHLQRNICNQELWIFFQPNQTPQLYPITFLEIAIFAVLWHAHTLLGGSQPHLQRCGVQDRPLHRQRFRAWGRASTNNPYEHPWETNDLRENFLGFSLAAQIALAPLRVESNNMGLFGQSLNGVSTLCDANCAKTCRGTWAPCEKGNGSPLPATNQLPAASRRTPYSIGSQSSLERGNCTHKVVGVGWLPFLFTLTFYFLFDCAVPLEVHDSDERKEEEHAVQEHSAEIGASTSRASERVERWARKREKQ